MGTVTAYNLNSIQAALGGTNPISLNEYYRGGSFVPTTRTTPAQDGPIYSRNPPFSLVVVAARSSFGRFWWQGTIIAETQAGSVVSGIYTYFRGAFREQVNDKVDYYYQYEIYRTYSASTSINTGVPSSGQISIQQLYGAVNP